MRGGGSPRARGGCSLDPAKAAELLLDEARLAIVAALAEGCRRFIELQRLLGLSKGSLYHHIAVLEDACIVARGYRLSPGDRPALLICLAPGAREALPRVLEELIRRLEDVHKLLTRS